MKPRYGKIHFKKSKPIYHKFYVKKKTTKNGRTKFVKKKRIFRIRIITFDQVSSPSLHYSTIKMVNYVSKKLKEEFPDHQVYQCRGLVEGPIINIMRGKDIE